MGFIDSARETRTNSEHQLPSLYKDDPRVLDESSRLTKIYEKLKDLSQSYPKWMQPASI